MGKSSSSEAPPPDPAIGQAAQANAELGKDYLQFTKDQWAAGNIRQDQYDALIGKVVDSQLGQQDKNNAYQDKLLGYQDEQLALQKAAQTQSDAYAKQQMDMQNYQFEQGKEQDAYNKATFRPVEQSMVSDAMGYDSADRQESMAGEAKADVIDAAQRQKDASARSMASMGVNPNSGRFAGITRAGDTATALGAAGAQNGARDKVRDMGIMLRKDAANYSKGIASTAAQSYGIGMQAGSNAQNANNPMNYAQLGLQAGGAAQAAGAAGVGAGSSAIGSAGAGNSNFYANNGIIGSGVNTAIGANSSAGGMLNTQYSNQLNAWGQQQQANASSSAGTMGAIGTVVGAGVMVF